MLKKLAITLVVFALLFAGVLLSLPKLVAYTDAENLVKKKVQEATGRTLEFKSARLVFFPEIAVALEEASLSNPDWAQEKNMVEVGRLDVALALAPLFERKVEVRRLVLKAPVIHLEKNANGRGSWEMSALKEKQQEEKKEPAVVEAEAAASGNAPFKFRLGEIKISDGAFSFADHAKKSVEKIDDVDISIVMPDLDSPLHIDGGLMFRDKHFDITLDVEKPLALMSGKSSKGRVKVGADVVKLSAGGALSIDGTLLKDGDIDAEISSLSGLVAWATGAKKKSLPFEKVSFKSAAEASATSVKLSGAKLSLDTVTAEGDVSASFAEKPKIVAKARLGSKLLLDRFFGTVDTGGAEGIAAAMSPPPKKKDEGWDDTPIDFSGLKALDADLTLDTQGFSLKGADVGPGRLSVKLENGALTASSSEATLFGGKFLSDLKINAASETPVLAFKFGMKGVEAKPVLTTFAKFNKLSGTVDADVDVTSAGKSQKDIIGRLAGKGGVVFHDGALEGIDLVNIAKMVQNRLDKMNVGAGKTEFVELGGTFTIDKGIVTNDDFKMKGPLVQASGTGNVDLPQKYLQYRVTPVLTASSAVDGAKGISVPVDIRGPFADISILPDYKSVLQDALKDPDSIRDTVKNVRDQAKPMLKELQKNPAAAIQGILNGNFGAQSEQPVESPPAE